MRKVVAVILALAAISAVNSKLLAEHTTLAAALHDADTAELYMDN